MGDNRTSNDGIGQNGTNSNLSVHGDPVIRRLPVIREDETTTSLSDIFPLESHIPSQPEPMEYVDHPVTFVPTPSTAVIYPPEPATTPPASPVDLTMLALLSLTVAGAGVMKTQTAIAKQNELNAQKAQDLANLQAQ